MPNRKIEGTFYLDGLLEGPIFSEDDESIIRDMVRQANKAGLKLHTAIDAGRFSLLADTEPVQIGPEGESPDSRVTKCLNGLLNNYSGEECMQMMSTLRSVEYIPGHEVQTLYGIKPDGALAVQQRTVEADTIRPAQPPDWRSRLKLAAVTLIVLCATIGISSFFIPYRDLARRLIDQARPFAIEDLKIDAGSYVEFFHVRLVELDKGKGIIGIMCEITPGYPKTEGEMNELWKASADSASRRLAIDALMRNCVRCEFFDVDDEFMGQQLCYMQWSKDDERLFGISIPFWKRLGRVRISY